MPFVEVFTREELSDAVRSKLAETLLVTMMNIEIGHPTDHSTRACEPFCVGVDFGIDSRRMGIRRVAIPDLTTAQ